jgi:uncharacterized membrane protein YhaH (DUF805 family)
MDALIILAIWGGLFIGLWASMRFAKSEKRIRRGMYAFQIIPGMLAAVLLTSWLEDYNADRISSDFALVIATMGYLVLLKMTQLSVYRAQDMGISKWWCLVLFVPPATVIFLLLLMFAKSAPHPAESAVLEQRVVR